MRASIGRSAPRSLVIAALISIISTLLALFSTPAFAAGTTVLLQRLNATGFSANGSTTSADGLTRTDFFVGVVKEANQEWTVNYAADIFTSDGFVFGAWGKAIGPPEVNFSEALTYAHLFATVHLISTDNGGGMGTTTLDLTWKASGPVINGTFLIKTKERGGDLWIQRVRGTERPAEVIGTISGISAGSATGTGSLFKNSNVSIEVVRTG